MNKKTFRQRWFPTFADAKEYVRGSVDEKFVYLVKTWSKSLALTGILLYGTCQGIGNSTKTKDTTYNGTVTSFGREGLIFDTWEGSFAIGGEQRSISGYFSLDEQMNETEKDALVVKLKKATEIGEPVRIHGNGYMATWPWRGSTRYLIDRVEPL